MSRDEIIREIERQVRDMCLRRIEPTRVELGATEYTTLLGEDQGTIDRLHFPDVWPHQVRFSNPPLFRRVDDRSVEILVVKSNKESGIHVTR